MLDRPTVARRPRRRTVPMTTHDPAAYPTLYPADDPARTTSPRQAMIEPLSAPVPRSLFPDRQTAEGEAPQPEASQPDVLDFAAAHLATHLPESLAFKRILVPLDGSVRAERALALAA